MNRVSSIRWNSQELFDHAQAYVEANHERMNSLIMAAVSEYLKNKEGKVSKLRAQTKAFSEGSPEEVRAWVQGHDTRGWK